MATEYPQAVYYPFRTTVESIPTSKREVLAPIQAKLNLPFLDVFVEALSQ
jgi:hypothetical protein